MRCDECHVMSCGVADARSCDLIALCGVINVIWYVSCGHVVMWSDQTMWCHDVRWMWCHEFMLCGVNWCQVMWSNVIWCHGVWSDVMSSWLRWMWMSCHLCGLMSGHVICVVWCGAYGVVRVVWCGMWPNFMGSEAMWVWNLLLRCLTEQRPAYKQASKLNKSISMMCAARA